MLLSALAMWSGVAILCWFGTDLPTLRLETNGWSKTMFALQNHRVHQSKGPTGRAGSLYAENPRFGPWHLLWISRSRWNNFAWGPGELLPLTENNAGIDGHPHPQARSGSVHTAPHVQTIIMSIVDVGCLFLCYCKVFFLTLLATCVVVLKKWGRWGLFLNKEVNK